MAGRAFSIFIVALLDVAVGVQLKAAEDKPSGAYTVGQKGPWRWLEQGEDSNNRNICEDGKQLPDLYVLGVQKCGTSSLAAALMGAGVHNVHSKENPKEFHFFNMPIKIDYALEWAEENSRPYSEYVNPFLKYLKWEGASLEQNKKEWKSWMPDCLNHKDHLPRRRVLADFTPDYHRIVPKSDEIGELGGIWRPVDEMNVSLPRYLRKVYGEEASKKLRFALMIREPLAQMQSAWYMAKASKFTYCRSCKGESFRSVLDENMKGLLQRPRNLTAWAWTTMYARQLEEYMRHFGANQFYIIPMHEFANGDSLEICESFRDMLDFKMDCSSKGAAEMTHQWAGKHPPLSEEITPEIRALFDKEMAGEKERLVKLLAEQHSRGMGLANYKGKAGDEDGIRKWLEAGW